MGKKHSAARGRAGSTGAVPALLCALLCALLPLTATAQSRGGGGERRANPAPQRQTQREPQAERNRTPQRRPAEPPSNQRPNTPQQRP
ncbi:MAG: hypothetical protein LBE59_04235, partial [Nevskiaceae bacterium]|nr:hypothetical protein [Nevskiaceae bacterium]